MCITYSLTLCVSLCLCLVYNCYSVYCLYYFYFFFWEFLFLFCSSLLETSSMLYQTLSILFFLRTIFIYILDYSRERRKKKRQLERKIVKAPIWSINCLFMSTAVSALNCISKWNSLLAVSLLRYFIVVFFLPLLRLLLLVNRKHAGEAMRTIAGNIFRLSSIRFVFVFCYFILV